jgi:hypothetical protein
MNGGKGDNQENDEGSEFNCDIFDIKTFANVTMYL